MNKVRRKVEGLRREIPYSKEKVKKRATLLYQSSRKRELKNKWINKEIIEKGKLEAGIIDDTITINKAEEQWRKAYEDQKEILAKGQEYREKDILDFHYSQIEAETEAEKRKRKQII